MIDGERKLATIRRISAIDPIPGADAIVKLTVDGWELVSQKSNGFKPTDLVCFFEVDSFLPVSDEFEFLRDRCFKSTVHLGDGFRLRTIKLRGQVSQGLALPMSEFFDLVDGRWTYRSYEDVDNSEFPVLEEGADVTNYFGVKKWEAPPERQGSSFGPSQSKGNFPTFLRKTDQERIQNAFGGIKKWITYAGKSEPRAITEQSAIDFLDMSANVFDMAASGVNTLVGQRLNSDSPPLTYWRDDGVWYTADPIMNTPEVAAERMKFEATMKLDGSSLTVYYNDGQIGVCSRNLDLKRVEGNVFWKTGLQTVLALAALGRNIAIQGELMGPGVQGNREGFETHKFCVFDIFDIDQQTYFTPHDRHEFLEMLVDQYNADCCHVPVIDPEYVAAFTSVSDFLEYADRPSVNHKVAEGVVFKSLVPGGPTFKAISNRYLLAEKD